MIDFLRQVIHFYQDPNNTFGTHTAQFLQICLYSIVLATVISLPLGVVASLQPVLAFVANNITGLMRAVPPLVFFFLIIGVLHVGIFQTTIFALVVLGIPPILLNTIAGITGVDPGARDAAQGMGMTRWQQLLRVELPLAFPIITAGVRISAVQIIATATIAATIGAGGYGDYLVAGINVLNYVAVVAGALPVAVLALGADLLLGAAQRWVTPRGVLARMQTEQEDVRSSSPVGAAA
jgi:osmoprotectant transport system permease protein